MEKVLNSILKLLLQLITIYFPLRYSVVTMIRLITLCD